MDGWPLRRSSRSRSRSRDVAEPARRGSEGGGKMMMYSPDLERSGMGRIRGGEGNNLFGGRNDVGKPAADATCDSAEENTFSLKLKQSSSRKAGMPIKMLIEEEMSKEFERRRASPSVIARLMGLDGLPTPRPVHRKNRKDPQTSSHGMTFMGLKERHGSLEDYSCSSGNDQQEFKDVYEVLETCKAYKHQHRPTEKGLPKPSQREKDINFIRKKFLDAKRLAADEKLQNSKDFSDSLDVLDSNKDVFLKFLQEPNSLFTKHLEDLQSVPSKPQLRHITLLKPSRITRLENCETHWASEREAESHNQMGKDVMNRLHKYDSDHFGNSIKDQSLFASHKLAKSKFEGKAENCSLPTRIVVLKPTLEKVQITDTFPSCAEKGPFSYRRQKEYRTSRSHKLVRQKLPNNIMIPKNRNTYSQMSKETSKGVRNVIRNGSFNALAYGCNEFDRNECSQQKRGKSFLLDAGSLTSGQYDDWNRSFISSSFHSAESSVSREARKHLSERWRISNRSQNGGLAGESSSTLGEMLSLSDRETPDMACKNDVHPRLDYPSGISSKDGWKDGYPRKLARSRSLPTSTTFPANPRQSNRIGSFGDGDYVLLKDVLNLTSKKSPEGNLFHQNIMSSQRDEASYSNKFLPLDPIKGEEGQLSTQEMYVEPDEHHNRTCLTWVRHELSEPSTSGYYDAMALADDITMEPLGTVASEKEDEEIPSILNKVELPPTAVSSEAMGDVADCHSNMISKEFFMEHPQAESVCNSLASEPESPSILNSYAGEPESPLACKDSEQSSPVSVLEPLDEEEQEQSSPECFEKVNADLQGLRLQLQLLKLETKGADVGVEVSSDEERVGDGVIPQTTEMLREISTDDERDFSYLMDMLSNAGIHGSAIEMVSAACNLPGCPVGSDIFDKLEKVHNEPSSWSRAERKFLFDLVNSVLMKIILPHIDIHPWVNCRKSLITQSQMVLADEVWQLLVKYRKELIDDPTELVLNCSWLGVADVIDVMGRDIEKMLGDDLLDEVVYEFLFW